MIDINKYESIVKLSLQEEERAWVDKRADIFIKKITTLDGIDVKNAIPLVSVLNVKSPLRADKVVKRLTRDDMLMNALDKYEGYYKAPKALE